MQPRTTVAGSCLAASLVVLVVSAPAAAAPRTISGTLSEPGYTVIALAANGRAEAVRPRRGRFRLRPPSGTVTLHLRAADGAYAGPVVVRRAGRRALLGVRAGARLGRITVRDGYARTARRLRRRWLDSRRSARARRGVPIGVGNFGRVRSRRTRTPAPGDRDIDGIPDRLDIDDDGDLVLDKLDRSRRTRAAQSGGQDPFDLATSLGAVPLERTANVNAGSTDAQIDTVLPDFGFLSVSVPRSGSAELDCGGTPNPSPPPPLAGGLSYCSYGGTGRVELPPPRNVFPECCDTDGDGFGALEPVVVGPDFLIFHLDHGATSSQIGTADTLILRVTDAGQETKLADMNQFIFATAPALASFVAEDGTTTVVPYPVSAGDPGTLENGFPLVDGPDAGSDVQVTVTLWRPQRRPTSQQECVQPPAPTCVQTEWIDVGGLDYAAASREGQVRTSDSGWCPQSAFATADPNLSPGFPDPQGGGFRDRAPSGRPSVTNTFTYTLNLTECLQRYGLTFNPGQTQAFHLQAFTPITGAGSAGVDNTSTLVSFTRR
ncbi:MAG: hypothetical protein WD844_14925 [Thermoleophilaceae bacterium]